MSPARFPALCLFLLSILGTGCTWFKKTPPPAPAPPTPQPAPAIVIPPPQPAQPKPLEEPQLPPKPLPPAEPEPNVIRPKLAPVQPPKPPVATKKRSRPATTAAKPAKPAESPAPQAPKAEQIPAPPPAEAPAMPKPEPEPKLGEVLPDAQRRAYLQSIEENIESARRALASLQGRTLTREQSEAEGRIRSFIKQAEDARATDVSIAVQLSRRAALLAKDLLDSLK
jgi:hypothetical protein